MSEYSFDVVLWTSIRLAVWGRAFFVIFYVCSEYFVNVLHILKGGDISVLQILIKKKGGRTVAEMLELIVNGSAIAANAGAIASCAIAFCIWRRSRSICNCYEKNNKKSRKKAHKLSKATR